MDLKQVRNMLDQSGLSSEGLEEVNAILKRAMERGCLIEEEKNKLLAILDIEIEAANIEADVLEELASGLDSFADEIDSILKDAETELQTIESDLEADIDSATKVHKTLS